ncbi:hypothetical protein ACJJTC_009981, partial [Scirpophaga incertulas]
ALSTNTCSLHTERRPRKFLWRPLHVAAESQPPEASSEEGECPVLGGAESLQLLVTLPPPAPPHLRLHYACEAGARILHAAVRWARRLPACFSLPFEMQVTLVKKCWPELFVLCLSKYSQALSLSTLLPQMESHLQDRSQGTDIQRWNGYLGTGPAGGHAHNRHAGQAGWRSQGVASRTGDAAAHHRPAAFSYA